MYYVTAKIKVISNKDFDEVITIFKNLEIETIKEHGCINFHSYPLNREEHTVMLWEIWKDKKSLEKHHEYEHTKKVANLKLTKVEWILESQV